MGNKIGAVLTGEEILSAQVSIEDLAKFIALMHSQKRRKDTIRIKALVESVVSTTCEESFAAFPLPPEEVSRETFYIKHLNKDNLDNDSIDFVVGTTVYSSNTILPEGMTEVELDEFAAKKTIAKFELEEGKKFDFFPGNNYYVLSKEEVKIPDFLRVFVDAKSTIGRLGCLCSYAGPEDHFQKSQSRVIVKITPCVFPMRVTIGKSPLFQAIFLYKEESHMTRKDLLRSEDLGVWVDKKRVKLEEVVDEDELLFHFSTRRAYVAKKLSKKELKKIEPIDVDKRDLDWNKYFEEVQGNNELTLDPGRFYLLGTQEYVEFGSICARLSRDVGGYSTGLWTQFAGVIHAGFKGEITLECWLSDPKMPKIIRDGEKAGSARIDELSKKTKKFEIQGSYMDQRAPRLPKVFKQD